MEESPQTSRNNFIVSVAVFPSLTQNLTLIDCSIVILQKFFSTTYQSHYPIALYKQK